eukprot:9168833-Pyramimonas_sp.AAC.1
MQMVSYISALVHMASFSYMRYASIHTWAQFLTKAINSILPELAHRLYTSSTWPTLSTAQVASLDDDITRMYRAVLKQPRKDNAALHNSYIRAQVLKADISIYIRAHRLRLFGRLVNNGPSHLMELLGVLHREVTDSWVSLIISELLWIREYARAVHDLPDPRHDLQAWERFARRSK